MSRQAFTLFKKPVPFLLFALFSFVKPASLVAAPESTILISNDYFKKTGDAYYTRRDYESAHLHYLHLYRMIPDEQSASRLFLSSLRREDERMLESLLYRPLPDAGFTYSYLSAYAAFRLQRYNLAWSIIKSFEARNGTDTGSNRSGEAEYRRMRFLRGAVILDLRRFDDAVLYYSELGRIDDATGKRSLMLAEDLRQHQLVSRKSPWLAASLSAVLPGAGQAYTEHYSDATMAFFWNLTFVGGTAYLYDLERSADRPHTGSIVTGIIGLIFYASNITGAYSSAHRRNVFMERRFAEHLRRSYFSTDLIERESGIEFTRPLE